MRILTFPSIKSYEMCYEGLLTIGTKGAETRTLARVLTKLERIGTKKLNKDGVESLLYTCAEVPTIKLEESELDFVKKKINEIEWNGLGAKEAGILLEWLDEKHPTEEEYEAQKVGILKIPTKD